MTGLKEIIAGRFLFGGNNDTRLRANIIQYMVFTKFPWLFHTLTFGKMWGLAVRTTCLKVHKIENFFDSDFGICVISFLVISKY